MQIVIDIPKKTYNELKTVTVTHAGEVFAQKLIKYIKNGTPLPKGHGDLIDRDALDREYDKSGWWEDTDEFVTSPMQDILFEAPIIIEADKIKER